MTSTIRRMGRRDDRGAVAVTVAILFMVFILLAALVVDVGYWYNVRRQLQSAADAAALAGCWELIKTGSDAETNATHMASVLLVAERYVEKNAVAPADGAKMIEPDEVNAASGHHYTEVTDTYVKVAARKQAPAFFARVLGYDSEWIIAQSRADVSYMQGLKGIVPFSLPVIEVPDAVTVAVNGGTPHAMTEYADGKYRVQFAAGVAARADAYPLNINVVNEFGVSTPLVSDDKPNESVGVIVRQSSASYTDIWLDKYVITYAEEDFTVRVAAASAPKKVKVNGNTYTDFFADVTPGVWKLTVPRDAFIDKNGKVPPLSQSFPVEINWSGNSWNTVGWIVVRRPSFPIRTASGAPHVVANANGVITVEIELNRLEYNRLYDLKISASGGETGNFAAVNLADIYHPPSVGSPSQPEYLVSGDHDSVYKTYLKQAFPYEIHIGDTIWTFTGAMGNPTDNALQERFAGDSYTWATWKDARPLTKRLIYVPLVEKRDSTTGHSPLVVVSFASFFVEDVSAGAVTGYFVEYVAGGQGTSLPPTSGFVVETPRLVSTGLDF